MKNLIIALFATLFLCGAAAGAAQEDSTGAKPTPGSRPSERIVARVNGVGLTQAALDRLFVAAKVPPAYRERFRRMALEKLIAKELARQFIEAETQEPTRAEIDDRFEAEWKKFEAFSKARGRTVSKPDFLVALNMTRSQIDKELKLSVRLEKWAKNAVTEEEISKYFDEHAKEYDMVRASHVLMKVVPSMDEATKEKLYSRMEEIRKRALAGEDFAELARKYSDCPSKRNGGDLSYFERNGGMVEQFAKAAFALKVGEISPVVETRFGFHVIKVTDRKKGEDRKEEVSNRIRAKLVSDKLDRAIEKKRAESKIELF